MHRNADFRLTAIPRSKSSSRTPADRDAGVVHQYVDRAEFACDPRRHLVDLRADGNVRARRDRLSAGGADLSDGGVSLLGAVLEIDRNRGAALGQRQCDRPPDAARSARDQRDTAVKINHIPPPLELSHASSFARGR